MRYIIYILITCLIGLPVAAEIQLEPGIVSPFSVQGTNDEPVVIRIPNPLRNCSVITVPDKTIIKTNENLKELEIYPYSVETKEITDELEAFRTQYAFVWVVLMGIQIYLVLNRSTYW
ncbi:MAG: hypothetical protein KJ732_08085 [Candidatus Margulisbacteria bacterium]|nr:hypothetical protein [Candidatus Margulisiibacteriota bacterium]